MNANRRWHDARRLCGWGLTASWLGLCALDFAAAAPAPVIPSPLNIAGAPLFLTGSALSNVLVVLDNSNSMDEAPSGEGVGSDDPSSKSEIARNAVKILINANLGDVNMGLMAYQQHPPQAGSYDEQTSPPGVYFGQIHSSFYDVSYDPSNYDPDYEGDRGSPTKRFRVENPSDPGSFIHYNVGLPFYSSSNKGDAFCYSGTADAFDNGEDPVSGLWDTYRCFWVKEGPSDDLPTDAASEDAAGYEQHFATGQFFPTDSDLAQGILDFGRFLTWSHTGPTWFSNDSPGRGYLHTPIAELDATQAGGLNTKLGTSQFITNAPTDPTQPIQNAGLTPIEGTLLTALDYFNGTLSEADEGYTASVYPLPESCDNDFVLLLTDGLPSVDEDGDRITDTVAAVDAAAAAAAQLHNADVETYVIGFALPFGVDPTLLDTIATAGGTGSAYFADDPASLQTALDDVLYKIVGAAGSAAAVALNTGSLAAGSRLYQARFDSRDWSGELLSFAINGDGSVGSVQWAAGQELSTVSFDSGRTILTYKPSSGIGIPFRWPADPTSPGANELDISQAEALDTDPDDRTLDGEGAARLNFLRGDSSHEGTGNGYRDRSGPLGDIVFSNPVYVGKPPARFPDSFCDLQGWDPTANQSCPTEPESGYSSFRNGSRAAMVYVGANDGMLHGFRADTGAEEIAYVPASVFENLNELTSPSYTHRYFVDGSPFAGDAFFGGAWHTVLLGGLNAGGQGIYALDVTDPASFSEGTASSTLLWELTDTNDPDLGYTFSQPSVVRLHNGVWAALFGNGYNNTDRDDVDADGDGTPACGTDVGSSSDDDADDGPCSASETGNAVLYIVNLETGALIEKIDTGVGMAEDPQGINRPNGLSTPAPIDFDGDFIVDYVYAGDLFGNLWKFDVTSSNSGSWDVMYGKPIFIAEDGGSPSQPQPITVRPEVSRHPQGGGFLIYFGTGKYFETGDNSSVDQQTQTFYGIWDKNENNLNKTMARSELLQQSIVEETTIGGFDYRIVSDERMDWSAYSGWRLDLLNTAGGNTDNQGERAVTGPVLRDNRIIFTTLIPSDRACEFGGNSWLMELDTNNGGRLDFSPFDVNGDGVFSLDDYVTVANPEPGDPTEAPVSGRKATVGIAPTPAIATGTGGDGYNCSSGDCIEHKYLSGSSSRIERVKENPGTGESGRTSWRELF
ncbi:MAG: PilC/PilY family type IV pilus protein [Pseudomonadota bacterium]|nr:PilC/PilY family type IV pilus protein [Pseudomonadota bacterium]